MFRKPTRKTPTGETHRHMILLRVWRKAVGSEVANINYVSLPISSSLEKPSFHHTFILAFYRW